VNVTVFVVPAGVTTLTLRAVAAAAVVIVQFAVTVVAVGVPVMGQVTPVPETLTAVAPVRLVPVRVTGTVVPRTPVLGAIDVSEAPCTVKARVFVLFPAGVVTRKLCAPRPAVVPLAMVKVVVSWVELTTVTVPTVIPAPEVKVTVVPLVVKFVPFTVTATLVPRTPEFGTTETRVGRLGVCTVNVTLLDVPFGVVTLTFLAPAAAAGAIVKVAVTVVSLTNVMLLTVTFVPDTLTAVVPVSPVPVRVTL
jgi:hypothetical protein